MDSIYPYDSRHPPLSILRHDRALFAEEFVARARQVSDQVLYHWLERDPHLVGLMMWLDDKYCSWIYRRTNKVLHISQSSLKHAWNDLSTRCSPSQVRRTLFEGELWPFVRQALGILYNKYCVQYDRVVLLEEYLQQGWPFYVDYHWVSQYRCEKARGGQRILRVHYEYEAHRGGGGDGGGKGCASCPLTLTLTQMNTERPGHYFVVVPYGLMYVIQALYECQVIKDVIGLCLRYFLPRLDGAPVVGPGHSRTHSTAEYRWAINRLHTNALNRVVGTE